MSYPDGWIAPHHLKELKGDKPGCVLASKEWPKVSPAFVPFYLAPTVERLEQDRDDWHKQSDLWKKKYEDLKLRMDGLEK